MTPEKLIEYELSSFAEYVSISWMQTIIGWWYAQKVNRKWARYVVRQARKEYLLKALSK